MFCFFRESRQAIKILAGKVDVLISRIHRMAGELDALTSSVDKLISVVHEFKVDLDAVIAAGNVPPGAALLALKAKVDQAVSDNPLPPPSSPVA